jgi:hypothetical protein
MGNSTIPMLTQAIGLTGAEQLEAVQEGASVRVTSSQIAGLVQVATATIVTGVFEATLTGVTTTVTGPINYTIAGNVCTLTSVGALTGTSNTATLSLAAVPAIVQPKTGAPVVPCLLTSNGVNLWGAATVAAGANSVNFYLQQTQTGTNPVGIVLATAAFSASGINGLPAGWAITYPIN